MSAVESWTSPGAVSLAPEPTASELAAWNAAASAATAPPPPLRLPMTYNQLISYLLTLEWWQ